MIFKRKIYDEMLAWKRTQNGRTALLLKGARRVGKTTVAKDFAEREYQSHVLIDFAKTSDDIRSLFDDLSNKECEKMYITASMTGGQDAERII